jgi:hypothetical protein
MLAGQLTLTNYHAMDGVCVFFQVSTHHKPGCCLALSPTGNLVATAAGDGAVIVQASSLSEGSRDSSRMAPHAAAAPAPPAGDSAAVAFDATEQWLASGAVDGSLFIYGNTGESNWGVQYLSGNCPITSPNISRDEQE